MVAAARIVIAIAALALAGCAGKPATGPKARDTFEQAIAVLSTVPIHHEKVDWAAVRGELAATFDGDAPPAASHRAIELAVAKLNDRHARFVPPPPPVPPSPPPSGAQPPAPPATKEPEQTKAAANQVPMTPAGRMLDGRVAYVVVPMCPGPDPESLRSYATTLRRAVLDLEGQHPAGWLIELRFNGGGNVWPMLIGLRPLLGDGVQFTSVLNERVTQSFGCDGGAAWLEDGGQRTEQLRVEAPAGDRLIKRAKIAVLTGPWTMSSGECVALAFRGRSKSFGDPTSGLTTVTNFYPLQDGSMLNLPVFLMADRDGAAPKGAIAPDIAVQSKGWPGPDDAQAKAARAWIAAQADAPP